MSLPTSHTYISQRLRLHYVDWGNKEAPPLLLLHGGRDHCRSWDWVAEKLRHQYHVIALDLRGHGDSEWVTGSTYHLMDYVYDVAQLIREKDMAPLTIIAHSLGGMVALLYSGLFSDNVRNVVTIEGLGPGVEEMRNMFDSPVSGRFKNWYQTMVELSDRAPRCFASLDDAVDRMQVEHPYLRPDQARHLTFHGVRKNDDDSYSWKFDNFVRLPSAFGVTCKESEELWGHIECPVLLVTGGKSFVPDPVKEGRTRHFRNIQVERFYNSSHWVHHDQLDGFIAVTEQFLAR